MKAEIIIKNRMKKSFARFGIEEVKIGSEIIKTKQYVGNKKNKKGQSAKKRKI